MSTAGDIIRTTVDGVDLADVFREYQNTVDLQNANRESIDGLFTFRTTAAGDQVPQGQTPEDFERASEHGLAKSLRSGGNFLTLGFPLEAYDLAARFTWRFLADADRAQVDAVHNAALEADSRLTHRLAFHALFNNTDRITAENLVAKPLYNGDGAVPPSFNGVDFTGATTQYVTSGASTFDGGDVADAYKLVSRHGYGDPAVGGRIVVFLNPLEGEKIRGLKAGTTNSPYDFIPSQDTGFAYLSSEQIIGDKAPSAFGRVRLFGSYGPAWLSENALIPQGYVLAVATYGPNDQRNPIAFREHVRPELRGLRIIPGGDRTHPIQDSTYQRLAGCAIRKRGGAAVIQVTSATTYTVPAEYAIAP
jgi:hypothetical protein